MTASVPRTTWSIAPGEGARLTPEGPWAAVIESAGPLPFRLQSTQGLAHRKVLLPGTAVRVGGDLYQVVQETHTAGGWQYGLEAWPPQHLVRQSVAYGPDFVHAVLRERAQVTAREALGGARWLLAPFVGLLPEETQWRVANRTGLDPVLCTILGAFLEAAIWLGIFVIAASGPLQSADVALASTVPIRLAGLAAALYRIIVALLFQEATGSPFVVAAFAVVEALGKPPEGLDFGKPPLSREAFWRRLTLPDRQFQESDLMWRIETLLPHLSWSEDRIVGESPDKFRVETLPARSEGGRVVYSYRLTSVRDPELTTDLPVPIPPDPQAYNQSIHAANEEEWDAIITAFNWVVSMLPRAAQARALDRLGGPAQVRRSAWITSLFQVSAGLCALLLTHQVLYGAFMLADGLWRVSCVARNRYAPSVLGYLVSDLLPPERRALMAHRRAEKEARAILEGRGTA